MTQVIRNWLRARRHLALVRQLKSLPAHELHALGIAPEEIERLALAASQE